MPAVPARGRRASSRPESPRRGLLPIDGGRDDGQTRSCCPERAARHRSSGGDMTSPDAQTESTSTMRPGDAPRSMWVGLAVGLLGFVVKLSFESVSSVHGEVAQCSYFDAGALLAAVVCLLCGILAIVRKLRSPARYPMHSRSEERRVGKECRSQESWKRLR